MDCKRVRKLIRRYHWTIICIRCRNLNHLRNHYTTWYDSLRPRSVGIAGASIEDDIINSLDVEDYVESRRSSKVGMRNGWRKSRDDSKNQSLNY